MAGGLMGSQALSTVAGRCSGSTGFRARFGDAGAHTCRAAAYFLGPGVAGALSAASTAGVSAAPIRWNIRYDCRRRSFAGLVWPTAVAQRLKSASAWASPRALPVARASSRACW